MTEACRAAPLPAPLNPQVSPTDLTIPDQVGLGWGITARVDFKSVLLQPANTVNYAAEILGCGEVARISASGVQRCGFRRGEQPRRLWYFSSQVSRKLLGTLL